MMKIHNKKNRITISETSNNQKIRGFFIKYIFIFLFTLPSYYHLYSIKIFNDSINKYEFIKTNSLKTNTLNYLLKYPSLSYEKRISYRGSINVALYGHDVIFITRSIGVGNIIGYRFYAFQEKNTPKLSSFYFNTGIHNYLNLNGFKDSGYKIIDKYQFGPFIGLGHLSYLKNNFLLDAGAHITIFPGISFIPGVYFSVGYTFSKRKK